MHYACKSPIYRPYSQYNHLGYSMRVLLTVSITTTRYGLASKGNVQVLRIYYKHIIL